MSLTCAINAEFGSSEGAGFDAVHIRTPTEPAFLRLQMGKPPAQVEPDSVRTDAQGLTVFLLQPVRSDSHVRIGMELSFYTVTTRLGGDVWNRRDRELRQQLDAGDATDELGSNQLHVLASGEHLDRVIGDMQIRPRIITPNGTGKTIACRSPTACSGSRAEVTMVFYTLDGRPFRRLDWTQPAGNHSVAWDGLDEYGRPLDPGLYLCQVTAKTDRGRFQTTRSVGVAY